jgi:peptidoglycan hydrolase CwlO-like protein
MKRPKYFTAFAFVVALSGVGCGNSFYSPSGHEDRIQYKEWILEQRTSELESLERDLADKHAKATMLNSRIRANEAAISRLGARPAASEINAAELERLNREGAILRSDLFETQGRIRQLEAEQIRLRSELLPTS